MALHVSEVPLVVTLNSPTFRSIATTVKVLESLLFGEPLSVTTTVMELVVVPGGPEGVQAKTPLVGLIVAPGGALVPRVKVNCWTGMSLSVAVKFKVSNLPFNTVRLVTALRCGGVLVARESGFAGSEPKSNSSRSK